MSPRVPVGLIIRYASHNLRFIYSIQHEELQRVPQSFYQKVKTRTCELGGAYFPNVLLSLSSSVNGARNMSILNLAAPVASPSPALHGLLTDHWGFPASFALGIATALAAFWLVWKLPFARKQS
jgi:hypothetical protein